MKLRTFLVLLCLTFSLFSYQGFAKPTSSFIKVNGLKLHYLNEGKKGNPLVIFLHGFPEYSGVWSSYFPFFKDKYFVVAPDMRGYNLSDKPLGIKDYTLGKLTNANAGACNAAALSQKPSEGRTW